MSCSGCCKTLQTPQNDSCLQAWMSAQRCGAAQDVRGPAARHRTAACSLKRASQWSSQGLGALLASFHVKFNGFTVIPQHHRGCPCEIRPHLHLQRVSVCALEGNSPQGCVVLERGLPCTSRSPDFLCLWRILSWLVLDSQCARLVPYTTSYTGRSSCITHT